MDRKPPTLLKSLPLGFIRLSPELSFAPTSHSRLLHLGSTTLAIASQQDGSIVSRHISISNIWLSRSSGISATDSSVTQSKGNLTLGESINGFIRTPNGRGLLCQGEGGEVTIWTKAKMHGPPKSGRRGPRALLGKAQWTPTQRPTKIAIFAKGRGIVSYHGDNGRGASIVLEHLEEGSQIPTAPVELPDFALLAGDEVEMLLAVSDIDDGYSGSDRKTQRAVIIAASTSGTAWVWRTTSRTQQTDPTVSPLIDTTPEITLVSQYQLPVEGGKPLHILPVDPMGWHQSVIDWSSDTPLQDMILTVSQDGMLEFWKPELGHHLIREGADDETKDHIHTGKPWVRSGSVNTGKKGIVRCRCSSRKKTVLSRLSPPRRSSELMMRTVYENSDGSQEMTIWDSNISEFSTGLELTHTFS
jgi:hypothetical protein